MKDKIRPLYSELHGYLVEAPLATDVSSYDTILVENLNKLIDKISAITTEKYERFKVRIISARTTLPGYSTPADFQIQEYRSHLSGLIANLHGQFFSDEPPPFSGMPNTVINATQMQSQSVDIQLILTIQSKIDEQLSKFPEGSNERTWAYPGFVDTPKS